MIIIHQVRKYAWKKDVHDEKIEYDYMKIFILLLFCVM